MESPVLPRLPTSPSLPLRHLFLLLLRCQDHPPDSANAALVGLEYIFGHRVGHLQHTVPLVTWVVYFVGFYHDTVGVSVLATNTCSAGRSSSVVKNLKRHRQLSSLCSLGTMTRWNSTLPLLLMTIIRWTVASDMNPFMWASLIVA